MHHRYQVQTIRSWLGMIRLPITVWKQSKMAFLVIPLFRIVIPRMVICITFPLPPTNKPLSRILTSICPNTVYSFIFFWLIAVFVFFPFSKLFLPCLFLSCISVLVRHCRTLLLLLPPPPPNVLIVAVDCPSGGFCAWGMAWEYPEDGWPWAANHMGAFT